MSNKEIKKIIFERLNRVGGQFNDPFADEFLFDYVNKPNVTGILQVKSKWFYYESDEKNVKCFTGPFNDREIIYVCAMILNISKFFDDYEFSDEAEETFFNVHYRSIKEVEENI